MYVLYAAFLFWSGIYLKSEYIDLLLPFINKKVSILIRGLILFTKVNKKQSIVTYQLIIVYAHVHLMTQPA